MNPSEKNTTAFELGGHTILPGTKSFIELPVSKLVTGNMISIPVKVFHGKYKGPVVWLSAAVHGDEVQGVEIIRRVSEIINPRNLCGTLITVPIVNVHGFLHNDRYLPDRRDLNRSFPGSAKGSLASRIAHLFMKEIVERSDYGIDLHTGSDGRNNLPQLRANLDDSESMQLAQVFAPPVIINSKERDGSLRSAVSDHCKAILLYEGGEANRFDDEAIRTGFLGITRVLSFLHMVEIEILQPHYEVLKSNKTSWLRAKKSGIVKLSKALGELVEKGDLLGEIHDSIGNRLSLVKAHISGILIGRIETPLVNQGDAICHIAEVEE